MRSGLLPVAFVDGLDTPLCRPVPLPAHLRHAKKHEGVEDPAQTLTYQRADRSSLLRGFLQILSREEQCSYAPVVILSHSTLLGLSGESPEDKAAVSSILLIVLELASTFF